jgi:hypothetical protein
MNKGKSLLSSIKFWNGTISFAMVGAATSVLFQQTGGTCGDYPQHFQVLYLGTTIGFVIGFIYNLFVNRITNGSLVFAANITLIRYFLACILLAYGIVKVMATQFPHMMANMDARFIELNPMRVAWTFFGYSKGYQMFLGWGEMIPGLLLLFRRTSLLGALIALIVMMNVFLINVFFDVCLKLNSGLYMGLSFYLLLQNTERLWNFFFTNKIALPETHTAIVQPAWLKLSNTIFNALVILLILGWAVNKTYETYQYSTRLASLPSVQGAWKVESSEKWKGGMWMTVEPADSIFANRIFFEGSLGVIKNEVIRDRFILSVDEMKKLLTCTFRTANNEFMSPVQWKFSKKGNDTLELLGRWKGDSLRMKCSLRKEKLTRF